MNKKITLYLLSASLLTLSEGYALFGFGEPKKDSPEAKVAKMVKEGFPSATFGSCTKTDGGVKFDVALKHYQNLFKNDPKLGKDYDSAVNKKLDQLKKCAQEKNPNFTQALAASCKTFQDIIPKDWTRSLALCAMVSGKQNAVEAKNEAIKFMKQDYGSSRFACSKEYGKINWSGATEKFKTLSADKSKADVFDEYRKITDDHIAALTKCAIEKNKNFAAVLNESCTKDAPIKPWKSANKLCAQAAKIMNDRGDAAAAATQAKVDDKLFPGLLGKVGCTKAVVEPFNPAGLADYLGRQVSALMSKTVSAEEKTGAPENIKRVFAYVDRLGKCAVNAGDVNFNKVLSEKFAEADENCELNALKQYKGAKIGALKAEYKKLCSAAKTTSVNIDHLDTVAQAKKALGVPSNRLGWVGFPTAVVAKLGNADNFEHLAKWFKLDKDGFNQHFGIILKGVSIGKSGKVANPKSVALLAEGCSTGGLAEFAAKSKMESVVAVCKVASEAGNEHGRQTSVEDAFNALKVPSGLMAPAAYKICNEAMTEVWQHEDGIKAIKTILANADALPRWQKHMAGIISCISNNDAKTGITQNPIMTSYIVAAGDELTKLGNPNLDTLVENARTIQKRKEDYFKKESGSADEEVAPDEKQDAPVDEEEAVEEEDAAPVDEEEAVEEEDAAPVDEEEAVDEEQDAPVDEEEAVEEEDAAPVDEEEAVEEEDAAPEEDAVEEDLATEDEVAPEEDADEEDTESVGPEESDAEVEDDGELEKPAPANDVEDEEVAWIS